LLNLGSRIQGPNARQRASTQASMSGIPLPSCPNRKLVPQCIPCHASIRSSRPSKRHRHGHDTTRPHPSEAQVTALHELIPWRTNRGTYCTVLYCLFPEP
jgi:hypothetical protein